jgi:hypothetical protein
MIIVLSGEAGAGKDSVADLLVTNHQFIKHSLASPLKRFAADMFGFTDEQLYGPSSSRNQHNDKWDLKCHKCGGTGNERVYYPPPVAPDYSIGKCSKCNGTGKTEISVRSTLQPLGTEYLRDMIHPDCLTYRATWDLKKYAKVGRSVVVNDARYQNDRNNLHAWVGAHRVDIRALEKHADGAAWRQHNSELDRPPNDQVEFILDNPEEWPFPSLPQRVSEMLVELRSCKTGH